MVDGHCRISGPAMSGMARPLRLVKPNEARTKLETVPETLELLRSVKAIMGQGDNRRLHSLFDPFQNPVAVVAIIGPQRGGKSTIMNLLHGRELSGFGLGHYMDAQTDGSLLSRPWPPCEPYPCTAHTMDVLRVDASLSSRSSARSF